MNFDSAPAGLTVLLLFGLDPLPAATTAHAGLAAWLLNKFIPFVERLVGQALERWAPDYQVQNRFSPVLETLQNAIRRGLQRASSATNVIPD